ncbi:MAG TPA: NEW3 domain-containing protein, partial [Bacteroidales bacterium]
MKMKHFFTPTLTKRVNLLIWFIFGIISLSSVPAFSANSLTLYTPYTKISVPPGQSIDYSIDVINSTSTVQNVEISIAGMPNGWTYDLKSGGWNIGQISVLPGERKNLSFKVEVPLKVNKGSYHFRVVAKGLYTLPLTVVVSEQGTYKTEFTTNQPNMQGAANSNFT